VRRGELGGDDEVALVLALGIVDDNHHLPVPDVLDGLLDGGERRDGGAHGSLAARSRSTTFARTSTSRLTSSPGSRPPSVVTESGAAPRPRYDVECETALPCLHNGEAHAGNGDGVTH